MKTIEVKKAFDGIGDSMVAKTITKEEGIVSSLLLIGHLLNDIREILIEKK